MCLKSFVTKERGRATGGVSSVVRVGWVAECKIIMVSGSDFRAQHSLMFSPPGSDIAAVCVEFKNGLPNPYRMSLF